MSRICAPRCVSQRFLRPSLALACMAVVWGCAPGVFVGRETVQQAVSDRARQPAAAEATDADPAVHNDSSLSSVNLADGLSEDEAAVLALARNARFQESLCQLEISWTELIRAGQLTNPQLSVLFPVGVKQLEMTLTVPLDVLVLRPRRVALAETEARRIAQQLVQEGLDTIRSARVAYADARLTQERLAVALAANQRRAEIARHATVGAKAGELSPLDAATAEVQHQRSQADVRRATQEAELAAQRLAVAIGQDDLCVPPLQDSTQSTWLAAPPESTAALIEQTLATRPDLLAAAEAIASAEQRASLANFDYLNVAAALPDYNSKGDQGAEAGPGVNLTLPIFHQNQAAKARTAAELDQAQRRFVTLRQAAALEVAQSHGRLLQARAEWLAVTQQIEPRAVAAFAAAANAYPKRGTTLPLLLELARQLDDAQARRVDLMADMRRAAAELDRSVGGRPCLPVAAAAAPALHR